MHFLSATGTFCSADCSLVHLERRCQVSFCAYASFQFLETCQSFHSFSKFFLRFSSPSQYTFPILFLLPFTAPLHCIFRVYFCSECLNLPEISGFFHCGMSCILINYDMSFLENKGHSMKTNGYTFWKLKLITFVINFYLIYFTCFFHFSFTIIALLMFPNKLMIRVWFYAVITVLLTLCLLML